ncbi:hypothetical protein KIN20_033717 [Parelaphostrongylus tenuis]|uniref:Uncharacterized protein n=1 Tax=Parelaphostrongylus tenuis TaxID=148309 RepID=A0AAD5WJ40_PARTN|nr:hypothetical protein KIN20_033717 [Parelaphostrongylus tenuis]
MSLITTTNTTIRGHELDEEVNFFQQSTSPESMVVTSPTRNSNSASKSIFSNGYVQHLSGPNRADSLELAASRRDGQRQVLLWTRGLLQSDPVTSTSSQSHPAGQRTATCRQIYKEEVDRTGRRGLTVFF